MIGKVINKYRIDKKLGEGGMGVVYKAWDVDLERPVALKMLHPGFSQDEAFLKRFRAEARALAKLDNRHIVTVYDLQKTDAGLFIVMQFVEGVTLAGKLEKCGPIPSAEALTIFKQLLEALSHAHQARIIHRDVKPSNVMLNQQGLVKVTDFGLAKVPYDSVLTQSHSTGGTLCYRPPEQIRSLANVDQRSDIYSAGMTLYEMLAGRLPFDKHENVYALAQIIVEGDFLPPEHYHAAIPQELSKIVMKAVAKQPANRHQSVEEISEALENFEAAEETRTLAPAIPKPRPGIKTRRVAIAVLSFLVFAALIFFFSIF
jgi:serine/threonine protein kinase